MGVFTTQTLLSSVGVSKNRATPGAVAINWILKVHEYNQHKLTEQELCILICSPSRDLLCSKQLISFVTFVCHVIIVAHITAETLLLNY